MRVSITTVYDLPDDLQHGELNLLQQKLTAQKGPSEIYLKAGSEGPARLVAPRVHTVHRPQVAPA